MALHEVRDDRGGLCLPLCVSVPHPVGSTFLGTITREFMVPAVLHLLLRGIDGRWRSIGI